jgi:hypothetical protein
MGMVRLLTDIACLTGAHIPRWFQTTGMSANKIETFYDDPVKQACDAKALHDSEYRRSVSTESNLRWQLHRLRVEAMAQVRARRSGTPIPAHPRVSRSQTSLMPG